MKLDPVPKAVPPVAELYQIIVPDDAVAPNVTVPEPHTVPGVVLVTICSWRTV